MIFKRFKHYTKRFVYLTRKFYDDFVISDKYTSINSMGHGCEIHMSGYNKNIITSITYKIYGYVVAYVNINHIGRVQYLDIINLFKSKRPPLTIFQFNAHDGKCVINKCCAKINTKLSFGIVTKDTTQIINYILDGPMYIKI